MSRMEVYRISSIWSYQRVEYQIEEIVDACFRVDVSITIEYLIMIMIIIIFIISKKLNTSFYIV